MTARLSLIELLQGLIERTFRMQTGGAAAHRFVLGDAGLQRIYGSRHLTTRVGSRASYDAKVLVREASGEIYVNIYYPDALIAELERCNPLAGLDARNLDAFAVFVEELDHFLTIADRARSNRRVSLFELELHANVTKYVTCRHFLERSLGRLLHRGESAWLRWSLFERQQPSPDSADVRARYRDADRLAGRYCSRLERLSGAARLRELRAFHPLSAGHAVRRIDLLHAV